ncbi:DNA cytosine methyltransferase [Candidatus Saccharibacteria bacterium]|nr:DNA cytosine methyltransferase [Candidatus Saccharibacteria bacterium]
MSESLKVLELFAGIGACSKALERLGIEHEIVDAVEIDRYAIKSFNAIHGTNFEPQDITIWDKDVSVDLIMHGSPCQDFSVAGRQAGGDEGSGTRSSLMYETLRIVEKLKPKYVIWENVKNIISKKHIHNWENYCTRMSDLGYCSWCKVMNAKDYGVPQNRERVFTVSIRKDISDKEFVFPESIPLEKKLKDMLEPEVDEKYFISENMMNYFMGVNQKPSKFPRKERFLANINRKDQDRANSITTAPGQRPTDNFIRVKTANKQGYDYATEGDGVDLQYPNSTTRRGRVGHEVSKTIMTGDGMGVVVKTNLKTDLCNKLVEENVVKGGEIINHSYTTSEQRNTLDKYIESKDGIMPTLTTRPDCLGYATLPPDIRIRKLAPKECWRLMGFDDADIDKAQAVGISNAQLYKQAGNSIVVNILEIILKKLLEAK